MSSFTIEDLRTCPALAGPDEVQMLVGVIDALRMALTAALSVIEERKDAA